jgi:hypothetical protein
VFVAPTATITLPLNNLQGITALPTIVGTANGTTNWSTPPIPLYIGDTTIVITAADAAGNTSWRSLTVTRN